MWQVIIDDDRRGKGKWDQKNSVWGFLASSSLAHSFSREALNTDPVVGITSALGIQLKIFKEVGKCLKGKEILKNKILEVHQTLIVRPHN